MKIQISKTLAKLPTIDVSTLVSLQKDLKDLSETNFEKLKKSLKEKGFRFPFFVWQDGKTNYTIDGNQRDRVFQKLNIVNQDGNKKFPFVPIEAKNKKEAAELILLFSSQIGKITQEGLDNFNSTFEISDVWIKEMVHFDGLLSENFTDEKPKKEEEELTPINYAHFLISVPIDEADKILPFINSAKENGAEVLSNVN